MSGKKCAFFHLTRFNILTRQHKTAALWHIAISQFFILPSPSLIFPRVTFHPVHSLCSNSPWPYCKHVSWYLYPQHWWKQPWCHARYCWKNCERWERVTDHFFGECVAVVCQPVFSLSVHAASSNRMALKCKKTMTQEKSHQQKHSQGPHHFIENTTKTGTFENTTFQKAQQESQKKRIFKRNCLKVKIFQQHRKKKIKKKEITLKLFLLFFFF